MSIEAMSLVLHHSAASGADKLVLLGIANHEGDGGAWPSVATLARYANVTPRSVQRSLGRLVDLGELTIEHNRGGTNDRADYLRPNLYRVQVACPAECDRTAQHRLTYGQDALWKNPTSPTSPGDAHVRGGVTPTSGGGGDAHVTQTVHINPDPTRRPASTTGVTPPCAECSAPNLDECARRQAKLTPADRHHYRAVKR